jgi:hypothetical protein
MILKADSMINSQIKNVIAAKKEAIIRDRKLIFFITPTFINS